MQKTKAAKSRKVGKKGKKQMVPRGPKTYSFTRLASSNAGTANGLPIQLATDLLGRPKFSTGFTSGENLALAFRLDQVDIYLNGTVGSTFALPGYTDFTNLFDQYCIKKIDVFVYPSWVSAGIGNTTLVGWLPWVVYAADYDNASSTGAQSLMQYDKAKYTQFLAYNKTPQSNKLISFKPQASLSIETVTGAVGSSPTDDVWISTTRANVQHFGFKMALDDSYNGSSPGTTYAGINIVCKYYIECKDIS